ncbi:hypothetical protein TNCV_2828731 [Trichonephila clavipes]|nr:hypothetical protein TNCV_2828731 [Trichonephila clavipes]
MLTAVPLGLGSNPVEGMDVCKCIVPMRHGSTLSSCRAASHLARLVEGEERLKGSIGRQALGNVYLFLVTKISHKATSFSDRYLEARMNSLSHYDI